MKLSLLVPLLLLAQVADAADLPRPGQLDPRIQTIAYDPDQVVLCVVRLDMFMLSSPQRKIGQYPWRFSELAGDAKSQGQRPVYQAHRLFRHQSHGADSAQALCI